MTPADANSTGAIADGDAADTNSTDVAGDIGCGVLRPTSGRLVVEHDVVLLDLDGVVYLGSSPVAGAASAIERVRASGARVAFVANNAARTPEAVASQLRSLDVPADPAEVVTSAQAAARVVADRFARHAGPPRVLAVGGEGLRLALTDVGCVLVSSADDRPDVVAQGFSTDLGYVDLAEAALAVRGGAWWIATNRDPTLPTDRGIQPGNGALVGAVAAAVGHPPAAFAGKPDAALLEEAVRRTGAHRPLMVGDRLDTDVEGAARVGVASMCVLTGVSTGAELVAAPRERRPAYIGASVSALLDPQPPVRAEGAGRWRCRGWVATVSGRRIVVTAAGGRPAQHPDVREGELGAVDLLRAVCAAAWTAFDGAPPDGVEVPEAAEGAVTAVRLDGLVRAGGRSVG